MVVKFALKFFLALKIFSLRFAGILEYQLPHLIFVLISPVTIVPSILSLSTRRLVKALPVAVLFRFGPIVNTIFPLLLQKLLFTL